MKNNNSRFIVYGDIHGCIEEFKALRSKINPKEDDEEFIIGDLLDRGPDSLSVLRYAREQNIKSILGNHEKKYLQYNKYIKSKHKKNHTSPQLDCQQKILFESMKKEDFEYLKGCPYYIKRGDITLIHAGLTNTIELSDKTSQQELDKITWIRFLDIDQNPISLNQEDEKSRFWSEYYDGGQGFIVYGHNVFDDIREENNTLGIDTGCVYGGKLSAVVFNDINDVKNKNIVQVNAKKDYTKETKSETIRFASFCTIYTFKCNKSQLEFLEKVQQIDLEKNGYLQDFIPYVQEINTVYKYSDIEYEYRYISSLEKTIKLEDRFLVVCEDDICMLVEWFKPLSCISYEDYIKLHFTMCVTKKHNKNKFVCAKNDLSKMKLSCFIGEKIEKGIDKENFSIKNVKKPVLIYRCDGIRFDKENIKTKLKDFGLKNIDKYADELEKEFKKNVKQATTLTEYLEELTKDIGFQKTINFESNLKSYHLIDNGSLGVRDDFLEALLQYRRRLEKNHNEVFDDIEHKHLNKDIKTYSNGNVVLHIGKNIFAKQMQTNIFNNYKKHHFYTYIITLTQFTVITNLVSEAIFKKYDNKDRLKMDDIKQRSLRFLSHVNFEKISYNSTVNTLYLYYREKFDIANMKNEITTIIDKIGYELEERHKKNIERWLIGLTVIVSTGSIKDIVESWALLSDIIKKVLGID